MKKTKIDCLNCERVTIIVHDLANTEDADLPEFCPFCAEPIPPEHEEEEQVEEE